MKIKSKQYAKLIISLVDLAEDDKQLEDFLLEVGKMIRKNKNNKKLKKILLLTEKLFDERFNVEKVKVETARPLSDAMKKEVIRLVQEKFDVDESREIEIEEVINEELIGGAIITCSGKMLDVSVKGQLGKIKNQVSK